MIVLGTKDIIRIITDHLTVANKQTPTIVEVKLDWNMVKYDIYHKEWYFDTTRTWNNVIQYSFGLGYKYINIQRIKEFLLKEYPEAKNMTIRIVCKDNNDLLKTSSIEDIMKLIEFKVEIEHSDRVLLNKKDYQDMIDLALMSGDKVWFKELTEQYQKALS